LDQTLVAVGAMLYSLHKWSEFLKLLCHDVNSVLVVVMLLLLLLMVMWTCAEIYMWHLY